MVPDGSNRSRGIDRTSHCMPLAFFCRLAESEPCMTSAGYAALWCRHGVSGGVLYPRAPKLHCDVLHRF